MRSQQIEEVAAQWLSKRDSGDWSDADERQLAQWLACSPANKIEYLRLRRVWNHADKLGELSEGSAADDIPLRGQWRVMQADRTDGSIAAAKEMPSTSGVRRISRGLLALAASVLVFVAVAASWWVTGRGQESYATTIGRVERVPLADGSQVMLNSNSKVQVTITDAQRRVDLREGEAFFDVAKDASRPFVVYAGDQRVVAVGTKFSVWKTGSSARVVVVEGRVRVETIAEDSRSMDSAEIAAGEIARANSEGVVVTNPNRQQAEASLAWRSGYLNFRDTTLSEAVAEFNRYNARKLIIADPAISQRRVGANLRMNNVTAFVRILEQEFDIHANDQGERILLSASRDSR